MAELVWVRPARDHLRGIVDYVARDSKVAAARLYARTLAAPKRLERFPLSGSVVPEFGDLSIREVLYGMYRIIYWVRDEQVRIVAVIHGSHEFLGAISRSDWEID